MGKSRFVDHNLDYIEIIKEVSEGKGLTPDQKKLHWENYAKTTERQELVFKKVFDNVFNEQKNQVIEQLKKN